MKERGNRTHFHVANGGEVFSAARTSSVVELAYPPSLLLMDIFNMGLDISLLLEPLATHRTREWPLVVVSSFVRLFSFV